MYEYTASNYYRTTCIDVYYFVAIDVLLYTVGISTNRLPLQHTLPMYLVMTKEIYEDIYILLESW